MADEKVEGLTGAQYQQVQIAANKRAEAKPIPIWDDEFPDPGPAAIAPTSSEKPAVEPKSDNNIFTSHDDVAPEINKNTRYFPVEGEGSASTTGVVKEGGRMQGLDGLADMWSMSRDMESSVAAIARIRMQAGFADNSNFDGADHLDELHAGLTSETDKMAVNELIAEANSIEEARFLKGRYQTERFQQAELAKYGLPGMISQFSAAMFDEGAIALGVATGGVGAAAYKLNRFKAILASGLLAATENVAVEVLLKEGNVTKGTEDLVYAAAIGAVMGGGFGAIFSRNAPGTAGAKLADDNAVRSVERLEEVDKAIIGDKVRDQAGADEPPTLSEAPDPAREVITQHESQLDQSIKDEFVPEVEPEASPAMKTLGGELDELQGELHAARGDMDDAIATGDTKARDAAEDKVDLLNMKLNAKDAELDAQYKAEFDAKKAKDEPIKDADSARDYDAELKEVDKKIAKQAAADAKADAPIDHTKAIDALDEVADEVSFIKSVRDGTVKLTEKQKIKANMDWDKAKRNIIQELQRVDPDGYKEITQGKQNPTLEDFETMLPAIDKAIRKAAKKADDATGKKAKTLDELATLKDELLDARDAAVKAAAKPKVAADAADAVPDPVTGGGAAGAANVNRAGEYGQVDLDNATPELMAYVAGHPESTFVRVGGNNQGKGVRIRFDLHASSQASPSKLHAVLGDHMGEDSVGKKNHDTSPVSASEMAVTNNNANEAAFTRVYTVAEKEWMVEMGIPKWKRWKPEIKEAFGIEVTNHKEFGKSNSPAVKRAADAMTDGINRTADNAKKYDVEGHREFENSDDYVSRIHDQEKIMQIQEKFGREAAMDIVEAGIRKAQPHIDDVDPKLAATLAKGYMDGISLRGAGARGQYHDLGIDSIEYVQGVLRDLNIGDDDTANFVKAMLRNTKEVKGSNTGSRAKKRLLMDVDVEKQYRNLETGEMETLKLTDMFIRDARVLTQHYIRNVGGMAAVAERTFGTPMHIRSRNDMERLLDTARRQHADAGGRPNNRAFKAGEASIRMMFDRTVGTPLHDPSSALTVWTRRIKNYNVSRLMGHVAFAQMSEGGTALSTVGVKDTLKNMPEYKHLWKRAQDGTLDNETLAVLEDWTGLATDRTNGRIDTRYDSGEDSILEMYGSKYDLVMNDVNRAVLKPMHLMLEAQQRIGAIVYTQKLTDAAMGLTKLPTSELNRLKGAGIGPKQLKAIFAQVKKHGKIPDGKKTTNPMLKDWDDAEAIDAFRYGIGRIIRRAVQENSIGSTSWLTNTRMGGLMTQFRGFMMTAASKQTLHGMHHRDMKTFQNFTMASTMASLGWMAQTQFKSVGRPDADEYREKMLTMENAAKAGFQRSAWATMMPAVIDQAISFTGNDPLFDYRSSGLQNSALDSIPTVDLFNKSVRGVKAVTGSIFQSDQQVARRNVNDIRYSLPLANMWATTHAWNFAVGLFPESKKQDD